MINKITKLLPRIYWNTKKYYKIMENYIAVSKKIQWAQIKLRKYSFSIHFFSACCSKVECESISNPACKSANIETKIAKHSSHLSPPPLSLSLSLSLCVKNLEFVCILSHIPFFLSFYVFYVSSKTKPIFTRSKERRFSLFYKNFANSFISCEILFSSQKS
jgi:hypothetical protein